MAGVLAEEHRGEGAMACASRYFQIVKNVGFGSGVYVLVYVKMRKKGDIYEAMGGRFYIF